MKFLKTISSLVVLCCGLFISVSSFAETCGQCTSTRMEACRSWHANDAKEYKKCSTSLRSYCAGIGSCAAIPKRKVHANTVPVLAADRSSVAKALIGSTDSSDETASEIAIAQSNASNASAQAAKEDAEQRALCGYRTKASCLNAFLGKTTPATNAQCNRCTKNQ